MYFTSIIPMQSSIHFSERFPQGIPESEGCLYTPWPAHSADLLADHLDAWQEHSSLGCHSEKHFAYFSAPLQLINWGSHSPLGHSEHGSFPLPGRNPVCKSVQLCCGGSLLYQTSFYFPSFCTWMPRTGIDPLDSFSMANWISAHWPFRCSREICSSMSPCCTKLSST